MLRSKNTSVTTCPLVAAVLGDLGADLDHAEEGASRKPTCSSSILGSLGLPKAHLLGEPRHSEI